MELVETSRTNQRYLTEQRIPTIDEPVEAFELWLVASQRLVLELAMAQAVEQAMWQPVRNERQAQGQGVVRCLCRRLLRLVWHPFPSMRCNWRRDVQTRQWTGSHARPFMREAGPGPQSTFTPSVVIIPPLTEGANRSSAVGVLPTV